MPSTTSSGNAFAPLIVIAPDSFKGSLDAKGVATAIASGLRRALPDAKVMIRPMADGGEGTIDAMATGDATIRKVGEILTACVRETGLVARFGGEEFVILLAGTPPDAVLALVERMRQSVQETPIVHGTSTIRITISLGVAIAGVEDQDIQSIIEGADRALYRAKQRGRNRAVLSA